MISSDYDEENSIIERNEEEDKRWLEMRKKRKKYKKCIEISYFMKKLFYFEKEKY